MGKERKKSFKYYTKEKMEMRKLKKVGQRFLCVLATVIVGLGVSGFSSFAAETGVLENALEEHPDVVVLEATVVEEIGRAHV